MIVRTTKATDMKDVYMQLLLHINEDLDDDLILDAIRILVNDDL